MGNPNNLNTGMQCIKFMIFLISLMFALTALLLLAVGTAISNIFGDFYIFVDAHFATPASLMIFIAICLFGVAICGCIGAIKESTMIINIFGLSLFVVFILEITAAIMAYTLNDQIFDMLTRTMNESWKLYDNNLYVRNVIDYTQSNLRCCGIDEPNDWLNIANSTDNNGAWPMSCCASVTKNSTADIITCDGIYSDGCLLRLKYIIYQSAMLIATGAATVAIVQFLGVVCAFMLAKTIRRTKSVRAARRWQLQQSLGVLTNPFSFDKQIEENTGRQYNPDPEYTQMGNQEKSNNSTVYLPTSPSVM